MACVSVLTSRSPGCRLCRTGMNLDFADSGLDSLETDSSFDHGLPRAAVVAYRKRLQGLRSAADRRDLFALASWHPEPLDGTLDGPLAVRLTGDVRLVLQVTQAAGVERIRIVRLEAAP